jgi:uncharacterized membrane protein YiaA
MTIGQFRELYPNAIITEPTTLYAVAGVAFVVGVISYAAGVWVLEQRRKEKANEKAKANK